MPFVPIFLAVVLAVTHAQNLTMCEIDTDYRNAIQEYARAEAVALEQGQLHVNDTDKGPYLASVVNTWLASVAQRRLLAGDTSLLGKCWVTLNRTSSKIDAGIQMAKNEPNFTPDPQVSEDVYKSMLIAIAKGWIGIIAFDDKEANTATKYGALIRRVRDAADGPLGNRAIVKSHDNGPACVNAMKRWAAAKVDMFNSLNDTLIDCTNQAANC